MANVCLKNICISGVASVVPSGVVNIEEEKSLSNVSASRIERLKKDIGIIKRHITLKNECTSDLCEIAARFLLSKLSLNPSQIDGLIMVTQTPDYFQPATSCVLHGKLDISNECATFDVNLGCSGYVYGLWLSAMMVATGSCKRVMLLAGDTTSRCVDPFDESTAPLFGDAGSATIIDRGSNNDKIYFSLNSDGSGYHHLIIPSGAFRNRLKNNTDKSEKMINNSKKSEDFLSMNGAEIFNFTIKEVPISINKLLSICGWDKNETDYFILHQANKFIIKNIARKLDVPADKIPFNVFEKYGNQSSASIPSTMCENFPKIKIKNTMKVILCGFGVGLSWANCALRIDPGVCFPVMVADQN